MPQWFYQCSPDNADPTERLVADALNRLTGDWIIRWGWHYQDNSRVWREGDFLILGPGGHVLVLEVKGTQVRGFALTGHWEDHGRRDPVEQLNAEWKAAFRMLGEKAGGRTVPFVHSALGLPNLHSLSQNDTAYRLPENIHIVDRRALDDFGTWWSRNVAPRKNLCPDSRKLFLRTFAKGIRPKDLRLFIDGSEHLFARFKGTEMGLLKRVWPNRQLLVKGGPGTGKTFMALQTAKHFAEADDGNDVLFVCYNLALGGILKNLAERLKPARGSITVYTWERLASETLQILGIDHEPPTEHEARCRYYDIDLPGYLHLAVADDKVAPRFDALIVDEAQDIDTRFPPEIPDAAENPGWWSFLLRLLKEGGRSRIGLFHDPAQRPAFRPDRFHLDDLLPAFSQPAIVHLDQAVRFTRPVFEFLRECAGDPPHPLLAGLLPHPFAPEGPAVELRQAEPGKVAEAVAEILETWWKNGFCKAKDICILGQPSRLEKSSLGHLTELAHHPLAEYPAPTAETGDPASETTPPQSPANGTLHYLSLNRAKGLDFLAVILIDTPRDPLTAFLLAASRARQILGVVESTAPENSQ